MLLGKTRKLWHQLLCKFWPLLLLLTSLYLHAILRYFPFVFCSFLCMWAYYPPIGENVIFISWFLTFIDLEQKVKKKIKQNLKALIPVFAFVLTTNAKNWFLEGRVYSQFWDFVFCFLIFQDFMFLDVQQLVSQLTCKLCSSRYQIPFYLWQIKHAQKQ